MHIQSGGKLHILKQSLHQDFKKKICINTFFTATRTIFFVNFRFLFAIFFLTFSMYYTSLQIRNFFTAQFIRFYFHDQ